VELLGGADEGPFATVNMSVVGVFESAPAFEELRAIGGGLFFFAIWPPTGGAALVGAGSVGDWGELTCKPRPLKLRFFRIGVDMRIMNFRR
jgi:hypothetical protein